MAHPGLIAYGGLSLLVLGGAVTLARRSAVPPEAEEPAGSSGTAAPPLPAGPTSSAAATVQRVPPAAPHPEDRVALVAAELANRLGELLSHPQISAEDDDEISKLEAELLALGEAAAPALIQRIDSAPKIVRLDRAFHLLRRLPGSAAEERLVKEARVGAGESGRALAIEALAARRTARTFEALGDIAQNDPTLPKHPLVAGPRDPNDTSTELPDEAVFTPRMQAMAALASTEDPRAAPILTGVLRGGPDESLRMEAARNLQNLRDQAGAAEALRAAATGDASPYVRLAALHSLAGSSDPALIPMLERIADRDQDAGVRALATRLLAARR